jgi:hypothetical protein
LDEMTNKKTRRKQWTRNLLVVLCGIVTAGILPVAFNFGGTADRLSFVPGISDSGGIVSAFSYTLFLGAFVGVALGGAYMSASDLPVENSGPSANGPAATPTPIQTPTAVVTEKPEPSTQTTKQAPTATRNVTPTSTLTSSPTQTPTPTSTPTPTPSDEEEDDAGLDYLKFAVGIQYEIKDISEQPIHLKGMYPDYDNATLWIIVNGTNTADNWDRAKAERSTIAHAYRRALVIHKRNDEPGDRPLRLRFVDWNESSQTTNSDTFFVHRYNAWAYQNGTISANEFFQRWFRSSHATQVWVEKKAKQIARNTSNTTLTPINESDSNESLTHALSPPSSDSQLSVEGDRTFSKEKPRQSVRVSLGSRADAPVASVQRGPRPT